TSRSHLCPDRNSPAHLHETAHHICKHHLARRPAFRRQQRGTTENNTSTPRPRSRHIEPIGIVEKLHSAWSIVSRRSRHRVDNNGRLLSLKFIDSSHPRPRQTVGEPIHLVVIRSDDQDIVESKWMLGAVAVRPGRSRPRKDLNSRGYPLHFFHRVTL